MGAKEKYNQIINKIEDEILNNPDDNLRDLAESLAKDCVMGFRDFSVAFRFVNGQLPQEYIRIRRMNAVYKMVISQPEVKTEELVRISGYETQSAMNKKFQEMFGMSPTEAQKKKLVEKLQPPLTWECISGKDFVSNDNDSEVWEENDMQSTIFGISPNAYKTIQEIVDLQFLYELDDEKSDWAYRLAKKYQLSLRSSFAFVSDYIECYGLPKDNTYEGLLRCVEQNEDLRYLCFDCKADVYKAKKYLDNMDIYGINSPKTVEKTEILYFLSHDYPLGLVHDAYDYFMCAHDGKYDAELFDAYVDILGGHSFYGKFFEEAYWEAYDMTDEHTKELADGEWLESIEDDLHHEILGSCWWETGEQYEENQREDNPYDEDNPYYEDDPYEEFDSFQMEQY